MDFLNFSLGGELSTPVGQAIERATQDTLVAPDWTQNLEICDMVNSNADGPEQAVRALRKRIKHDKANVVLLALTIVETCVKNCGLNFHRAIATRDFMDDLTPLAVRKKGEKLQHETLRLVQQWAMAFKQRSDALGIFYDTYQQMRMQNLPFPPVDEHDVPVIDPPSQHTATSSNNYGAAAAAATTTNHPPQAAASQGMSPEEELARLSDDLDSVMEKVKLCREMLPESPGIHADEALADVIGFLEACRDRMVDLIEAGTQGLLGEDLLEKALKVNDALLRTLEAEKTGKATFDDDLASPNKQSQAATGDLLDLDAPAASAARSPPTGLQGAEADDDEFSSLNLKTSRKPGQKGRTTGTTGTTGAAGMTGATGAPLVVPTPAAAPKPVMGSPTAAPTPFNSVQSQQPATADMFASSTSIDLLFGSTTPAAEGHVNASSTGSPADATATTTTSTTAPAPTTTTAAPTSTLMSDDEFENFLNSMSAPQRS